MCVSVCEVLGMSAFIPPTPGCARGPSRRLPRLPFLVDVWSWLHETLIRAAVFSTISF